MDPVDYIPYRQIPVTLGIRKGDLIMLASGLTMLALWARRNEGEFSVDALIDAFIKQIGNDGTLIIPAYNHTLKYHDRFDILKSKPITGILAETALQRDDFIRTRHPLHSFLVYGKHASDLAGLENKSSFGNDSPFAWMYEHDARMLMLGTTVSESFTFTHFVEEQEKVPYRKHRKYRIEMTGSDGKSSTEEFMLYSKKSGWTMNMKGLEGALEEIALNKGKINGLSYTMVSLKKAFEVITDDIRNNNARSIARFDASLLLKENLKKVLNIISYRTVTDKIKNDSGL